MNTKAVEQKATKGRTPNWVERRGSRVENAGIVKTGNAGKFRLEDKSGEQGKWDRTALPRWEPHL